MPIRQQRDLCEAVEKLQAMRDLRMLDLLRVAAHADPNAFERYRSDLERRIDPDAGVVIIDLRNPNAR
jgi:hypothetical protein